MTFSRTEKAEFATMMVSELKKITVLLTDSLMAGMKSWDQGSLAERVEILLEMYTSAQEEVARLEDEQGTKFEDGYAAGHADGFAEAQAEQGTKFDDGYTAGFEDGFEQAQADRSGEM